MSQIIPGITSRVDMRNELGAMSLHCKEYFLSSQSNSCSVLLSLKKKKKKLVFLAESVHMPLSSQYSNSYFSE